MNPLTNLRFAIARLWAARGRSILTMLGIVVGTASLIALTSVATAATTSITASLGGLGATNITVQASGPDVLTSTDQQAIEAIPGISAVASSVSGTATLSFGPSTTSVAVQGVSDGYAAALHPTVAVGSFLPDFPHADTADTVVLSADAARKLHFRAHDIGEPILIDGQPFTTVGVLDDARGPGASGTATVSIRAARSLFAAPGAVTTITATATTAENVPTVQQQVQQALQRAHGSADGRWTVANASAILNAVAKINNELALLVGGIAGISLLVGGIGILNIMLVSVRERTREIGVRRAIGAKRSDVLGQFLVESMVIATIGGIVGAGLGVVLAAVIDRIGGWSLVLSPTTIGTGIGFAVLSGALFGVWPAATAARLHPVEALRTE